MSSKNSGTPPRKQKGDDQLLTAFDEVIPTSGSKKSTQGTPVKEEGQSKKSAPKSLYERLVGKSVVTNEAKKSSVKAAIVNWFAKESAEERAIRHVLKNYRNKLTLETQNISKAVQKHKRRYQEQTIEFEKQEKQLIAWGLKGVIQKFHMQAWFRLERCKLQENITTEIEEIVTKRYNNSVQYLQQFEESPNRKEKFSLKEAEGFCQNPDALILLDSSVLALHERLKKLDLLCTYATRQFLLLEPEFAWKDTKKRTQILHTILYNYNNLPQLNDLVNIETDLSWESFCTWCAIRQHKLKQIEQEYSDFIEDQRELEGRLFFRWHSSVLLTIRSPDQIASARMESTEGNDPEHLKSRPTALRVTPASIKAFVRYFATEIIGPKYEIPKDCIDASVALTESLFFRRLAPFVFRYSDRFQKEKDDFWRIHSQKCRYVSPGVYHVPIEYYKGAEAKEQLKRAKKESEDNASQCSNETLTANSIEQMMLQREAMRHSQAALQAELPNFASLQFPTHKPTPQTPPSNSAANAIGMNNSSIASFVISPPMPSTESPKKTQLKSNPSPPTIPSRVETSPLPREKLIVHDETEDEIAVAKIENQESFDETELQFTIEESNSQSIDPNIPEKEGVSNENTTASQQVPTTLAITQPSLIREASDYTVESSYSGFQDESVNILTALHGGGSGAIGGQRNEDSAVTTNSAATAATNQHSSQGNQPHHHHHHHHTNNPGDSHQQHHHHQHHNTENRLSRAQTAPPEKFQELEKAENKNEKVRSTSRPKPVSISSENLSAHNQQQQQQLQNKDNSNSMSFRMSASKPHSPGKPSSRSYNYCNCIYCQTFSLSLRLQKFPKYENGMEEGLPYARSSRVLSWMNTTVTPREMIFFLSLACKWILRDAIDISGSRSVIGADTMVPLFTMVLIHARITNIHLLLYILMQYGEYDEQGDVSYNIANLEGSMMFIMQMEIPEETSLKFQQTSLYESILGSIKGPGKAAVAAAIAAGGNANATLLPGSSPADGNNGILSSSPSSLEREQLTKPTPISSSTMNTGNTRTQEDLKAMQELGEWLRDQQTMEETIAILQNDGWML